MARLMILIKKSNMKKRLKDTETKVANSTKLSDSTRLYEQYINILKRELFTPKKSRISIKVPQSVKK